MIPPSRSQKTSAFVQGFDVFCLRTLFQWYRHFFYEFSAFIQALDLAVWTLRFNKNLPQPEWMCCGKLLGTLPSPVLTITLHAEELIGLKITRSGAALPQMSRIVSLLLLVEAKRTKKRVSNIKHFQMLKLMFYLKITMLMLSLLLLLFVCLLHNEKPSFPPLSVKSWLPSVDGVCTYNVSTSCKWQTDNTVVWITVC